MRDERERESRCLTLIIPVCSLRQYAIYYAQDEYTMQYTSHEYRKPSIKRACWYYRRNNLFPVHGRWSRRRLIGSLESGPESFVYCYARRMRELSKISSRRDQGVMEDIELDDGDVHDPEEFPFLKWNIVHSVMKFPKSHVLNKRLNQWRKHGKCVCFVFCHTITCPCTRRPTYGRNIKNT